MSLVRILAWAVASAGVLAFGLAAWIGLLVAVVSAQGAPADTRSTLLVYAGFIYVKGLVPQIILGFGLFAALDRVRVAAGRPETRANVALGLGAALVLAGILVVGTLLPGRFLGLAPVRFDSLFHAGRTALEMTAAIAAAAGASAWLSGRRSGFGVSPRRSAAVALVLAAGGLTGVAPDATAAEEWALFRADDGIRVHTRAVEGSANVAFRGEGLVSAPIERVFALVEDSARFKDWFPDTPVSFLVKREGDVVYQYSVLDTPWPTRDRDSVFRIDLTRDASSGRITLRIVAAPDAHPTDEKRRRVRNARGTWIFEPRGEDATFVSIAMHYEPGDDIPAALANRRMREIAFEAIENLRAILAD